MARSDLETALAAEPSGWRQFLPGARALLALVLLETADPRDARAVLDQRVIEVDGPVHSMTTLFLDARARVRLALGEAVEARADFEAAGRLAVGVFGCHNPAVLAWRSGAAVAAHRQGQPAAARKLVADELRDARRFGEPRALARVLRVDGLLRRGDAGLHALEDALEIVEDSSARLEHAWVLADLGGALRRAGRVNDALVHLRHGADLASQLGATVLAERIRDELHLAGARPRRERSSGPLALTPGEARVAARAAAGATNREIAQELYISVKAVEFHLRNAYGKLSIRSRRELADALDGIDVAS
jgi:DNA-binding CsgD family transcriptional regulator